MPRHDRPRQARPRQARPCQAAPGQAMPRLATPRQVRPSKARPHHTTPRHATPRRAVSKRAAASAGWRGEGERGGRERSCGVGVLPGLKRSVSAPVASRVSAVGGQPQPAASRGTHLADEAHGCLGMTLCMSGCRQASWASDGKLEAQAARFRSVACSLPWQRRRPRGKPRRAPLCATRAAAAAHAHWHRCAQRLRRA